MISLEQTARRVIATSIAYYGLDVSLVPDHEFDGWCVQLADRWDELRPTTQWKLGTAEEIGASGFHIKIRQLDLYGTRTWIREKGLLRYGLMSDPKRWLPVPKWVLKAELGPDVVTDTERSKEDFMYLRWSTVDNAQWNYEEPIQ